MEVVIKLLYSCKICGITLAGTANAWYCYDYVAKGPGTDRRPYLRRGMHPLISFKLKMQHHAPEHCYSHNQGRS
jgi:hypothetical protein